MEEIWKDIEGYEGLYQISNLGRVKSLGNTHYKTTRILVVYKNKNGYCGINLCKKGKVTKYRIHRLVATAFIPNPNNYPEVNHKDENKSNNRVDNLEWCTHHYNSIYNELPKRIGKIIQKTKYCNNIKNYRIKAINLTTGEEFNTMYDASKKYATIFNISLHNATNRLHNLKKQNNENGICFGCKWRFIKETDNH